jgi:hypothetical protein
LGRNRHPVFEIREAIAGFVNVGASMYHTDRASRTTGLFYIRKNSVNVRAEPHRRTRSMNTKTYANDQQH